MNAFAGELDWVAIVGSVTTVVAFATFVAIVAWAWSGRRRASFAAAANAPFALPDEAPEDEEEARR